MVSRLGCVALAALAVPLVASSQIDEHGDSDHTLEVSRVLPPELIKGPNWEVIDPVVNYFAHDQFVISSDYGDFDAHGQMHLRILLREIQAIATLKKQTKTRVTAQTVVRQGKKSVDSVVQVAAHPIQAARGITSGIMSRFRKTVRDVKEDVDTARSDASARDKGEAIAGRWLGVDKAWRRWASELRIDPYTINPVLIAELERVAAIEASAELGTKWVMPSIPGLGFMRDIYSLVTTMDPRELLEYNTKQMMALGATKASVDAFLNHPEYSPTAATTMIAGVAELDGVDSRLDLLGQAMTSQSNIESMFFLESVAMALWYHENRTSLERIIVRTGLPAAITTDGKVVVFAAVDFPHWSAELSQLMTDMDAEYANDGREHTLLLAGNAQGVFRDHMRELGWQLDLNLRDEYLAMLPWAVTNGEVKAR